MEPQHNKVESVIAPLKKVTPLSKYLALALFVILPFLGGWIGYTYTPEKVVEVENVVIKEVALEKADGGANIDNDNVVQPIQLFERDTSKQQLLEHLTNYNATKNTELNCSEVIVGSDVVGEFCEEYWPGYEMVANTFLLIYGVEYLYVVNTGIKPPELGSLFINSMGD